MKQYKTQMIVISVFTVLGLLCLELCSWIGDMSFFGSSLELKRQQMDTQISDMVDRVETSLNFGKTLESYYGMDEVLKEVCGTADKMEAVVLDEKGTLLYTSYKDRKKGEEPLSGILSGSFQGKIKDLGKDARLIEDSSSDYQYLVFPIWKNRKEFSGSLVTIYKPEQIARQSKNSQGIIFVILAVMLLVLLVYMKAGGQKKFLLRWMNGIVIAGMLVLSLCLFQSYKAQYEKLIQENAEATAAHIADNLSALLKKGLAEEQLPQMKDYLQSQIEKNKVCRDILLTAVQTEEKDYPGQNICQRIEGAAQWELRLFIRTDYQRRLLLTMALTFLSILIITLILALELFHLAEVIENRMAEDFDTGSVMQRRGMGVQIKLLSFFLYMGIYLSISYTAVIMREQRAVLFGLPDSVSASLPLTLELTMMMIFSLLLSRLDRRMKPKEVLLGAALILTAGNLACTRVENPYLLMLLRAYCGIGFAFAKYFLSMLVASASEEERELNFNYAQMNAGVLGGITAGAALGGVLAGSFGYRANYGFTLAVIFAVCQGGFLCIPWKYVLAKRAEAVERVQRNRSRGGAAKVLLRPRVLAVLFLGAVPLNIGLMYVVSFLPVYMSSRGGTPLLISYAYLLNGVAGIYIGAGMVKLLQRLSGRISAAAAFLIGGAGILILTAGKGMGIIFVSAALMGLFDGYGTPSVTGAYINHPALKQQDKAKLLTTFNTVGSAVQILCPALYNLLIQPDGKTLYLMIFGILFVLAGGAFYLLTGRKRGEERL